MSKETNLNFAAELRKMKPTEVVRDERVKARFIAVFDSIWGGGGEAAYEREAIYVNRQLRDKPKLRECTGISLFYAFIDLAVKGLSLDGGSQALCYLLPRNCKVGADEQGNPRYESVCNLTISGYGELVMRAKAGQIRYADNPVIVYEGDRFEYGEKDGRKFVNYAAVLPRQSNRIVACFLKITRADGSVDYSVMVESDWARLKTYSDKNNTYYDKLSKSYKTVSNDLYVQNNGQIDTSFLMAKCIKHAFKTYPKLKIGQGSAFESDIVDESTEEFDPYGGVVQEDAATQRQREPESFAPAQDMSAGITVNTTDDDTF